VVLEYYVFAVSILIDEKSAISEAVKLVAELMIVSAKTAPKARGVDNVVSTILVSREELEKLARKMEELAEMHGEYFKRDADNVRNSDAVVIIGCKITNIGLRKVETLKFDPDYVGSIINLGIALGSAVKTASMLNVDNRIMYSAGLAALELKLIDADIAYGIPLSVKAKNIYFDRVRPHIKP
jgi:uncharacterized ferredoxin-like protein